MHADWKAAKKAANDEFNKTMSKLQTVDALTGQNYPLATVFTQKLGPNLDSYEKEKDGKKKAALKVKIDAAVSKYKQAIAKHKAALDKQSANICKPLLDALKKIEGAVV